MTAAADCRLIGAGDGSVMVYCRPCREVLPHREFRGNLDTAQQVWNTHLAATHPATTAPEDDLQRAARALADVLGSEEVGSNVGTHMTCTEAEAVADVMRAAGQAGAAAAFLVGHGEDDDEGDDHYAPDGRCPACAVDLRQFWHTKWCPRFRG